IDHFGAINETWGHATGDDVLIEVAHRLSATLPSTSILSRSSGDDFIVLSPATSPDEAGIISRRMMQRIHEPLTVAGQTIRLTCSIGIAAFPDNGATLLELTQAAESAVHQVKREGRNQFQFYSTELQEHAQRAWRLERALHHALAEHQLSLHYQPQVDIHSERLIGLEALLRWHHPEWGWISPAEFIPIAEESGMIREIGHWVISTAIQQNAAWRARGLQIVPVAVNLSLSQFKDRGLCTHIEQCLRDHALPPHLLELELTESVAMANSAYTIATIDAFKRLGVALAIDDFGTGYSCLSYLKRFAVDKLKVDQSFVRGLKHDPHDEAIVKTIINLAKSMGLQTIAEGVETQEQLMFLRQNGCDQFQGYLRSRPLPPDQLMSMLEPAVVTKPNCQRGVGLQEDRPAE
ncbi:MAG TPA: bifunctional diguanylate cyclase/phosphodiesterase, partial [Aquabacterium sp.]|nr:bifunctional diguanylate cyclase/phosphodiesterase [Aquabacterium sp.]